MSTNDNLIAIIRTGYQAAVAALLTFLLRLGIDVDSVALDAVLWPLVMLAYYAVARWVTARVDSSKLATALTGPGPAPTYPTTPVV